METNPQIRTSLEFQERSQKVWAGGPATLSKAPERFSAHAPRFLTSGKGCKVYDVDGNVYLDTIAGLGPVLFGHCDPDIDRAVKKQVDRGASFSLPHTLELVAAELICEHVVAAERVRFAKNGADVTQAAIRVARRETGKAHIICCGYHGGHDWYISTTENNGGLLPIVGEYSHQVQWGNAAEFRKVINAYRADIAAIIVEVPPMPWGTPDEYFTQSLTEVEAFARNVEAVFIIDEIVTGFRYGLSGAHGRFGIVPDLVCLGKGMANGYPLAAIAGRADYMQHFENGDVFLSTTNGGDAVSLAACVATIEKLANTIEQSVLRSRYLEWLEIVGTTLGDGLQEIFMKYDLPVTINGDYARMVLNWRDDLYEEGRATKEQLRTLWLQETLRQGVLFGGPTFPMICMTRTDVQIILKAAEKTAERIAWAMVTRHIDNIIDGPLVGDVFKQRYPNKGKAG